MNRLHDVSHLSGGAVLANAVNLLRGVANFAVASLLIAVPSPRLSGRFHGGNAPTGA